MFSYIIYCQILYQRSTHFLSRFLFQHHQSLPSALGMGNSQFFSESNILWKHLKRKRFRGLKFRRQYGIDRHVVDFYCPKLRLAIELDGINHLGKKQKLKDQKRQAEVESCGIKVIRYMNTDIYDNIDGVVEDLNCKINEMYFSDWRIGNWRQSSLLHK